MNGCEVVRSLQERAARALPAGYVEHVDGWWLRHLRAGPWWAGTVLPHGDAGPGELAGRVIAAEKFYAGRHASARFQISPPACSEEFDMILAERGYRRRTAMRLPLPHRLMATSRFVQGMAGQSDCALQLPS
jgi:hypothetical protein